MAANVKALVLYLALTVLGAWLVAHAVVIPATAAYAAIFAPINGALSR